MMKKINITIFIVLLLSNTLVCMEAGYTSDLDSNLVSLFEHDIKKIEPHIKDFSGKTDEIRGILRSIDPANVPVPDKVVEINVDSTLSPRPTKKIKYSNKKR